MKTSEELANAVQSYQDGDREAFATVYEQSYRYLRACVMHVVRDEEAAQDMLQETYLEIVKSAETLKDAQNFLNWAAVIANRKCFAYLKKNKNLPVEDMDGIFEEIPDDMALIPEELMQDGEKRRLIREIIDGLSDMQRLCVIGYYYNEQSQESLAEEFGVPVGTVKSHLSRARAKIKLAVEELDVKKGTRLYNVAPLMFVLLEEEAKACILQPMSAALAGLAGAETAGKVSFFAKLKAAWAKLSAGAKAKAVAGAAAACAAGVAAAVVFSGPKTEPPRISEETKELLDQVMQVCEEGDYGKLCNLDFSVADAEEDDYPGTNVICCHDEKGKSILGQFHYNDDGRKDFAWYYDGKSRKLKETYTGYGVFIRGPYFAVGQFEDGQATGKCVSFYVRIHNDESNEKNPDLVGMDDTEVLLTEVKIEKGVLAGEASRMWYSLDASGQPYLYHIVTGNAVPVRYQQGDAHPVEFYFDGKIEYFGSFSEPESHTFYLIAGGIDPEHYRNLNGEWLDENGKAVELYSNHRLGERMALFSLIIDSTMFDLDSMEVFDAEEI